MTAVLTGFLKSLVLFASVPKEGFKKETPFPFSVLTGFYYEKTINKIFIVSDFRKNMAIGATIIIIGVLVAAIWIIVEAKRLKHKIFAIFIIALIILTYISFTTIIKENKIDLKTSSGIISASKLYFSWLGNTFSNVKSLTTFALKQNWSKVNESVLEENK